jgi:hypothetical protein
VKATALAAFVRNLIGIGIGGIIKNMEKEMLRKVFVVFMGTWELWEPWKPVGTVGTLVGKFIQNMTKLRKLFLETGGNLGGLPVDTGVVEAKNPTGSVTSGNRGVAPL